MIEHHLDNSFLAIQLSGEIVYSIAVSTSWEKKDKLLAFIDSSRLHPWSLQAVQMVKWMKLALSPNI